MKIRSPSARGLATFAGVCALAAAFPPVTSAHARISPAVSLSNRLQLYSLAVPTEKSGVSTIKVVMAVPKGFGIDSFAPPPAGWRMQVEQSGSGDSAVFTRVTWTGGHTPTGEDSLFQFLAQPESAGSYTFRVEQTYSNGSIVNWAGSEPSEAPAPAIDVATSLGAGGTSALTIVALVVGALGLLAGGFALIGGSRGRALA